MSTSSIDVLSRLHKDTRVMFSTDLQQTVSQDNRAQQPIAQDKWQEEIRATIAETELDNVPLLSHRPKSPWFNEPLPTAHEDRRSTEHETKSEKKSTAKTADIFSLIMQKKESALKLREFAVNLNLRLQSFYPNTNGRESVPPDLLQRSDRRLDSMAALVVGDETCAAVAFCNNVFYFATNKHSIQTPSSKFKERIFKLYLHLANIAIHSLMAGKQVYHFKILISTRDDFILEAIASYLVKANLDKAPYDTFAKMFISKMIVDGVWQGTSSFESQDEYNEMVNQLDDHCAKKMLDVAGRYLYDKHDATFDQLKDHLTFYFPTSLLVDHFNKFYSTAESDDDIAGLWRNKFEGCEQYKTLSKFLGEETVKKLLGIIEAYLRHMIKLENFYSDIKTNLEFILSMANSKFTFIPYATEGEGVHAEMRLFELRFRDSLPIYYFGISKLCCAHCNVVMKVFNVEEKTEDKESIYQSRGTHGNTYYWPLNPYLQQNEIFLEKFLGNSYAQFRAIDEENKSIALQIIQCIGDFSKAAE